MGATVDTASENTITDGIGTVSSRYSHHTTDGRTGSSDAGRNNNILQCTWGSAATKTSHHSSTIIINIIVSTINDATGNGQVFNGYSIMIPGSSLIIPSFTE
jgi:hypothetical protein